MQISDRSKIEIEVELIILICILDRGPRYEKFMNEFSEIVSTWRNLHLHGYAHINNGWCSGKAKYICNPTALGFDLNFWSLIIWFVMHDKYKNETDCHTICPSSSKVSTFLFCWPTKCLLIKWSRPSFRSLLFFVANEELRVSTHTHTHERGWFLQNCRTVQTALAF